MAIVCSIGASAFVSAAPDRAPLRERAGVLLQNACPGDCNGDGAVTIDELLRGVGIGLGTTPLERCPAFDHDADGVVSIDELVRAVSYALQGCPRSRPAKLWGVDANYTQLYEESGRTWSVDGHEVDPIAELGRRGANTFRLRIWVENEPGNLEPGTLERHARPLARRAQAAGMYVIPTLFMSQGWGADTKQDAPAAWADLPLDARAEAARTWARDAVTLLLEDGLQTSTYAIGNETDYGFCGVFRISEDLDELRREIWPGAARLMRATIAGIEDATGRSDLELILHISRGYDAELAIAFFETMRREGVRFSLAGLSYYPSAWGQERSERFEETVRRLHDELGLRTFVAEYAYAAEPTFPGWDRQLDDYALDEAGQARFVSDLRRRVFDDDRFAGAIYWSPEEAHRAFPWSAMGLWRPAIDGRSTAPRAALDSLGEEPDTAVIHENGWSTPAKLPVALK